ncbi:hypothetical protein FQR65_LT20960 [Abscondita terminalis]|nr:hypothetical protein FQR65_LT20960 [Abscondita terminalis]
MADSTGLICERTVRTGPAWPILCCTTRFEARTDPFHQPDLQYIPKTPATRPRIFVNRFRSKAAEHQRRGEVAPARAASAWLRPSPPRCCMRRPASLAALDGYRITSVVDPVGPSNPLFKTAALQAGAWFANYRAHPALWLVPALGLLLPLLAALGMWLRREWLALLSGGLGIAAIIASVARAMFPFMPALVAGFRSLQPHGLDSSSSSCDAVHHAGVRADLRAPDRGLHGLGLQVTARKVRSPMASSKAVAIPID